MLGPMEHEELSKQLEEARKRLSESEERAQALEHELGRVRQASGTRVRWAKRFLSWFFSLLAGKSVRDALRRVLAAAEERRLPTGEEVADLLSAVFGKVVRVGIVTVLIAAVPTALSFWQTLEINSQTGAIIRQTEQEREANYETRKAQLLAIIYDTEQQEQKEQKSTPLPKASLRARQEAAMSFAKLQSDRRLKVDLSRAVLNSADLSGAELVDVDLSRADLWLADLSRADLIGADLSRAKLLNAKLVGADLSRANLSGADLSGADLSGANLYGATFTLEQVDRFTFEFSLFDYIGAPYDRR
jgi:hypothetical protein